MKNKHSILSTGQKAQGEPTIVVTTTRDNPPLYQNNWVTFATYSGPAEQRPANVEFFVDAGADTDHVFSTVNIRSMDSNEASTLITGFGPNEDVTVKIYARPVGDVGVPPPTGFTLVPKEVTFKAVSGPPKPVVSKPLAMDTPDGNPLSVNTLHLLTATFRNFDGTPVTSGTGQDEWDGNIVWRAEAWSAPMDLIWQTTTPADANGVATNPVTCSAPGYYNMDAIAYTNGGSYLGGLYMELIFQHDVSMEGQGAIVVQLDESGPLTLNAWHRVTATYRDSQHNLVDKAWITWTGSPAAQLTFQNGEKTQTTNGVAVNYVQASDAREISTAYISATSPNDVTGANDFGLSAPIDFAPPLTGIMLDKAYAQTPQGTHVKPNNPKQNIKCQVQVLGQQGVQQVSLPTTPSQTGAKMFKADGTGDELGMVNGNYVVNTDTSGIGTFLVGSDGFTLFDLNAQWNNQTLPAPAKLVLATNRQQVNPVVPKPVVPDLHGGTTLEIPPAPAPTFKVKIPNNRYVTPGTTVAVLLNDRLVYDGVAESALNDGVDVAYAALDLISANNLVYVPGVALESDQLTFTAVGIPQTEPDTGDALRTLKAPTLSLKSGQKIGPKDIIDGGLPVVIQKYDPITPDVDVITLYFYLAGTDVLTAKRVSNIVSVVYPVTSDTSFPLTLLLPQQYAAGYANGQLQADYKVVNPTTGTRWSWTLSRTYALNTTF